MSFLTKYGTIFGSVPHTFGRVFFVAPSSPYYLNGKSFDASDGNDGLSPERALATINRAITLAGIGENTGSAISNTGEVVMLLPGTHTVTSTINVNVAGLTIWGATSAEDRHPRNGPYRTVVTSTGTNDELFNITVSNVELGYFTARPTSGFSAISFQTTNAIGGLYFHDMTIDMLAPVAPSLNTIGFDFANRAGGISQAKVASTLSVATAFIERVTVQAEGAQGPGFSLATCHVHVKDTRIHGQRGTWASPFLCATNVDMTLLENVVWTTSGAISACIAQDNTGGDTPAANGVCLVNCRFQVTNADIEGFTAGSLDTITSYEPTSGGTLSVIG